MFCCVYDLFQWVMKSVSNLAVALPSISGLNANTSNKTTLVGLSLQKFEVKPSSIDRKSTDSGMIPLSLRIGIMDLLVFYFWVHQQKRYTGNMVKIFVVKLESENFFISFNENP